MMAPPRQYNLTPQAREFRKLAEAADLDTEGDIAEAIGVSVRAARGYRNGDSIPEPVIRLMRAIVKFEINPDDLL